MCIPAMIIVLVDVSIRWKNFKLNYLTTDMNKIAQIVFSYMYQSMCINRLSYRNLVSDKSETQNSGKGKY